MTGRLGSSSEERAASPQMADVPGARHSFLVARPRPPEDKPTFSTGCQAVGQYTTTRVVASRAWPAYQLLLRRRRHGLVSHRRRLPLPHPDDDQRPRFPVTRPSATVLSSSRSQAPPGNALSWRLRLPPRTTGITSPIMATQALLQRGGASGHCAARRSLGTRIQG